jgi:hypothetical protein
MFVVAPVKEIMGFISASVWQTMGVPTMCNMPSATGLGGNIKMGPLLRIAEGSGTVRTTTILLLLGLLALLLPLQLLDGAPP